MLGSVLAPSGGEDSHQDSVVEPVVAPDRLPHPPLPLEPQVLVRVDRRLVEVEDAQGHAVETQIFEGVAQDQAYRLRAETLVTGLRFSHDHGKVRRGIGLADVRQADHTYRLVYALPVNGERVVCGRLLPLLEEPLDPCSLHRPRYPAR